MMDTYSKRPGFGLGARPLWLGLRLVAFWVILHSVSNTALSQGYCIDGLQGECTCPTTPILCTVDELDGYIFTMSEYQHPLDAPHPLCIEQGWGVPNNPTWFAWVATCTEVRITFKILGCEPFTGNLQGVQLAVYLGCPDVDGLGAEHISCNTAPEECQPVNKTLDFMMTIGDIYYLVIDGCSGAPCTVEIDVWDECGMLVLGNWVLPMQGPEEVCVGAEETYSTARVEGGNFYHWYLDGQLIHEGSQLREITHLWDTPGTFELCVDVSTLGCIPVTEDPEPLCKTITVYQPEAGEVDISPNPACPGEGVFISASGYAEDDGYENFIVVLDSQETIIRVTQSDGLFFTNPECASFTAYSFNYYDNGENFPPALGGNFDPTACSCCDYDSIAFEVIDTLEPEFVNPPPDITLTCYDQLQPIQSIDWVDNCGSGTQTFAELGSANLCDGGTVIRSWRVIDRCENEISHVQTLTIQATPPPAFAELPSDTSMACNDIPSSFPSLAYSNDPNSCVIAGTVLPVVQRNYTVCGGNVTLLYAYTDTCGRTISHTRNITVLPAPAVAWVSPPVDTTMECISWPGNVQNLGYSNGLSGECAVNGTVQGVQTGSDLCAGVATWQWEYVDPCGNVLTHTQQVFTTPPSSEFLSTPADVTVDCDAVPGNLPYLYISNGVSQGICAVDDSVQALLSGNYDACGGSLQYDWYWTGPCGVQLSHSQQIEVLAAPQPVFDPVQIPVEIEAVDLSNVLLQLPFSNGLTGECERSGIATAELISDFNPCGGTASFSWVISDLCGEEITESHLAIVLPSPVSIEAGADRTLNCSTPNVILNATTSHPANTSWITPDGTISSSVDLLATEPGEYIAVVSFADTCVFRDTLEVFADASLPIVSAGPDQSLNCEVREVLLEAEVLTGSGNVIYEWSDVNGNVLGSGSTIPVDVTGTFFVRIYDEDVDCWSEKDAVVVNDISNDPSAIIYANPGNVLSCRIEYIIVSADKENNVVYTWMAGGQTIMDTSLLITMPGTVTLIAIDTITRCESIDSIAVNDVDEYPIVTIRPPDAITCINDVVLLDARNSIPGPSVGIYTWTNLAGDTLGNETMLQVAVEGQYILTILDPFNECVSDDTVLVEDIRVQPEIIDAPDVLLGCDEENGMLDLVLSGGVDDAEIEWSTANGQIIGRRDTTVVHYSGPGTYIVEIVHTPSHCVDRDTMMITQVTEMPEAIVIEAEPTSCIAVSDGVLTLGSISGGTPPYIVYVNGIETTQTSFADLPVGQYVIEVEDVYGCVLEETAIISAGDEVEVQLRPEVNIKEGDSTRLDATVNIPLEEIQSIQWTPADSLSCTNCLSTFADPVRTTAYTIVVTDVNGCEGEATVIVHVERETEIFIPNVISPNDDQVNDLLTVYSNNPESHVISFEIFDRWGELMFSRKDFAPNNPAVGWDGTFKGKTMLPGVFVYVAVVEEKPGKVKVYSGDVTVVR